MRSGRTPLHSRSVSRGGCIEGFCFLIRDCLVRAGSLYEPKPQTLILQHTLSDVSLSQPDCMVEHRESLKAGDCLRQPSSYLITNISSIIPLGHCEKVFSSSQISSVFAALSHLHVSDHQTHFYVRQRQPE